MNVKINKATTDDSDFISKMILFSSRADKKFGLFDYLFEVSSEEELLKKIQLLVVDESKCYCHYSNFLVANVDGKNVGTLCTYEPRVATKEKFIQALKNTGCDNKIDEKLNILKNCEFDINHATLMFDFLEELDGYVDVGILKALMQKSLLNARLKGYRIAQSIVEIGSLERELFYEKLGFNKKDSKECETYKEIFGRVGVNLFELEF